MKEYKCTLCDAVISGVTPGQLRVCDCGNLTISNVQGHDIIKAYYIDHILEKHDDEAEFYELVY